MLWLAIGLVTRYLCPAKTGEAFLPSCAPCFPTLIHRSTWYIPFTLRIFVVWPVLMLMILGNLPNMTSLPDSTNLPTPMRAFLTGATVHVMLLLWPSMVTPVTLIWPRLGMGLLSLPAPLKVCPALDSAVSSILISGSASGGITGRTALESTTADNRRQPSLFCTPSLGLYR